MAEVLGERPATVARELTKLYEELRRGSLAELAAHYATAGAPTGEMVIVIGGADEAAARAAITDDDIDAALEAALATMSVKDASTAVAEATGRPRREVYQRALIVAGRGE
jgi:16S rRNA (cytidine1402-2'-O)-methyltransferase